VAALAEIKSTATVRVMLAWTAEAKLVFSVEATESAYSSGDDEEVLLSSVTISKSTDQVNVARRRRRRLLVMVTPKFLMASEATLAVLAMVPLSVSSSEDEMVP